MSERNWKIFINDIKTCVERILEYSNGLNYEMLINDNKTYDAILRNIEIIGEAVKNIPEEIKNKNNYIEWKKIAGLRDVVIHDYFGLNNELIWDVIKNKIPELKQDLDKLEIS